MSTPTNGLVLAGKLGRLRDYFRTDAWWDAVISLASGARSVRPCAFRNRRFPATGAAPQRRDGIGTSRPVGLPLL